MSANVVLLYSQAPQTESSNPFARPMTNQFVGQPANLVKKFGSDCCCGTALLHTDAFLAASLTLRLSCL